MKVQSYFQKRNILFLLFALLYLFQLHKVCSTHNRYNKVINEDAFGYYAILPAIFEYQDPEFAFFDSVLQKNDPYKNYIPPVVNTLKSGQKVSKYYSGVALLQSPFYLIARLVAKYKGENIGFEPTYHYAILLSVIVYLLSGFFILMKILLRIGSPLWLCFLVMLMGLYGSNFYAYSTYDMAYSHVYSFFALLFFILALLHLKEKPNLQKGIICGLLFGLVVIIRPLNGICFLFVPVIFRLKDLAQLLQPNQIKIILVGLFSFLLVFSIQSILWHWQTGEWLVYPYGDEKLNFSDPKMFELVFGFNSGWAIYSPLPFLMLLTGIILLFYQKKMRQAVWVLLSSISIIYLLSCWYYLHYGCTVGCRPITEFYGPLSVVFTLAVLPYVHSRWFRFILLPLMFVLLVYNQILHSQFFNHIINWCDMDQKRFRMVFLKTNPVYNYSCSPFWDFSAFNESPVIGRLHPQIKLRIDEQKNTDTFTYRLPVFKTNDSALLFSLEIEGKMHRKINESFLRLLITENGDYVELLNLLLMRKIEQEDHSTTFIYQFNINRSLAHAKVHMSLESVDGDSETDLNIKMIEVKRIKF